MSILHHQVSPSPPFTPHIYLTYAPAITLPLAIGAMAEHFEAADDFWSESERRKKMGQHSKKKKKISQHAAAGSTKRQHALADSSSTADSRIRRRSTRPDQGSAKRYIIVHAINL
jgi:hypothetical protein